MKRIEKILEVITVLLMALLVVIVSIQIFSRLLNHPFIWTEELSRFSLVYITFLGAALVYYKGDGLRIMMFIDRFSPRMRKVNDYIMLVLSLVLTLCLIYVSFHLAQEVWGTSSTALRWNKGMIVLVIPVGFILILLKLVREFKKIILNK